MWDVITTNTSSQLPATAASGCLNRCCVQGVTDQVRTRCAYYITINGFFWIPWLVHNVCIERSIFQNFWKTDSCTAFLFLGLETSNCGCLPFFNLHRHPRVGGLPPQDRHCRAAKAGLPPQGRHTKPATAGSRPQTRHRRAAPGSPWQSRHRKAAIAGPPPQGCHRRAATAVSWYCTSFSSNTVTEFLVMLGVI